VALCGADRARDHLGQVRTRRQVRARLELRRRGAGEGVVKTLIGRS